MRVSVVTNEARAEMQEKENEDKKRGCLDIALPQSIIESFVRFLLPKAREYYNVRERLARTAQQLKQ